jgi:hypothetical protein
VYGGEPVGYVIELENGVRLYQFPFTPSSGGALCTLAGREACHPHALRHLPSPDWHASTIEGRIAQTGPGERRGDRNDAGANHHVGKTSS